MSPLETSWRGRHVVVGIEDDVCTMRGEVMVMGRRK